MVRTTVLGTVGVILHLKGLALALGIVGDDQLHRTDHRHHTLGSLIEVLPEAVLQEAVLHGAGSLGHADALTEIADGGGGIARRRRPQRVGHPGIIPAGDFAALYQSAELALAHNGVVDTQAGKLNLTGLSRQITVLHHPVIQGRWASNSKEQRLWVIPSRRPRWDGQSRTWGRCTTCPPGVMVHVVDAVDHRVTHIEVAGSRVDLSPQGHSAIRELAGAHPGKEVQALLHGTIPVGALSGTVYIAPHLLHLLRVSSQT